MKFTDRCGDCGGDIKESKVSKRGDICDECWERREWIVKNMSRIVEWMGLSNLQKLQRSMAYQTGTAKRKILKLQTDYGHELYWRGRRNSGSEVGEQG